RHYCSLSSLSFPEDNSSSIVDLDFNLFFGVNWGAKQQQRSSVIFDLDCTITRRRHRRSPQTHLHFSAKGAKNNSSNSSRSGVVVDLDCTVHSWNWELTTWILKRTMDINQTVNLETGLIQNSKCYLRCNLIAPKWNGRLQKEIALHYILSYLDTKSSVQRCILSSRWRSVWKYVDVLTFNQSSFQSNWYFEQYVDNVLSLRCDGSRVRKVRTDF
ncbi:hypothetical protein LINPERHAP1_LOCUS17190, partial [Linum perenne]